MRLLRILICWILTLSFEVWAAQPTTSIPAQPEEHDAEGHPTDFKNPIKDGSVGGVPHYHLTICRGTTLGPWRPWGSGERSNEPKSDEAKNRDTTPAAQSGKSHAAASSAGGTDGGIAVTGRSEGSTECTVTLKEDDGTVRTLVVLVHVVECDNKNLGHRGVTGNAALPTGDSLPTLIQDGQLRVETAGTGETIGHIADLRVENLTDQPISCTVPPMILESSSGKNQHYACPKGQNVALAPHGKKTVPIDGVCISRNKPPVGKGVTGDLVVNQGDPTGPQDSNSHLSPKDANKLLRICTSKYDAADKLLKDGALKDIPYADPKKKKDIVVQWSTWVDPQISEITGAPPASKDDLKKVVYKQLETQGPLTPAKKKKVDEGIDTIFEKVELTTAKAKDLEQPDPFSQSGPVEVSDNQGQSAEPSPPSTQEKEAPPKQANPLNPAGGAAGTGIVNDPDMQARIEAAKIAKKEVLRTQEKLKKIKEQNEKKKNDAIDKDPQVKPLESEIERLTKLKNDPRASESDKTFWQKQIDEKRKELSNVRTNAGDRWNGTGEAKQAAKDAKAAEAEANKAKDEYKPYQDLDKYTEEATQEKVEEPNPTQPKDPKP